MAKRFPLPTANRRQVSTALVVLVLVLGVVYVIATLPQTPPVFIPPSASVLQDFRNTCAKAARRANGGGDLVMDDETEERIGAYCGCVADAVTGNVAPDEITRIAQGTASDRTMQLLTRIVEGCKPQLE